MTLIREELRGQEIYGFVTHGGFHRMVKLLLERTLERGRAMFVRVYRISGECQQWGSSDR